MRSYRRCRLAVAALAAAATTAAAPADTLDWPVGQPHPYRADSGPRENPADAPAAVWRELVTVEGAAWLRLHFGAETSLSPGSFVRVTSLHDLEVQDLDAATIAMWRLTSAYFNGATLLVELVAGGRAGADRVVIDHVTLEFGAPIALGGCGFCGADTREPSNEDWACRLLPAGCSASIYNTESCIVSAGHCVDGSNNDVVQFRVPPSRNDCNLNHPPVADQFPITAKIFRNAGPGHDWAAMTSGPNNLGQTIFERYGVFRPIANSGPFVGNPVNIWGYGVDSQCTRSQSQQVDTDPGTVTTVGSTVFQHTTDSTFGNSGSAVIREGRILGIATHCPCPNIATRIDNPEFAQARFDLCGDDGPANNSCENATPVGEGAFEYTTIGSTTDGPILPEDCEQRFLRNDVWFLYAPTCSGTATAGTCDSDFDSMIAVSTADACPGEHVACNDDACGEEGTRAAVSFPVEAGRAYLVRIGAANATGSGVLEITCEKGSACPEDFDDSGDVGFPDLVQLLSVWGPYEPCPPFAPEDLDESCDVGFGDLLDLLDSWGACP